MSSLERFFDPTGRIVLFIIEEIRSSSSVREVWLSVKGFQAREGHGGQNLLDTIFLPSGIGSVFSVENKTGDAR